ncbi:MAG: IS4 family transposase [Steroidobacteraceae bacterium]
MRAEAAEKVQWYGKRWGVETWHKVLKSGCKVEDCLLEEAERLQRYLTLFSIIGVRLMHVTYLARAQPEAPATPVFGAEEIEALRLRLKKKTQPLPEPPRTLRDVVRMIGRLGGHLGRKGDGEPGVTVLWRGWMRLYEDVSILRAYKESLGLINPS